MGNLREQILNIEDRQTTVLVVPEWGGIEVTLRAMSGHQVAEYTKKVESLKDENALDATTYLITLSVIDPETGEAVFSEEDVKNLNNKSLKALERVAKACMGLNKMDVEDNVNTLKETADE